MYKRLDTIISMSSRQLIDCALYIDFKRAFDVVCHNKLISKLEAYGIEGDLLAWLKVFLWNRVQYVSVKHALSSACPVTSGVPQGSVLGPLLFLVYINDVCSISTGTVFIKLFADDLKLYSEVSLDKHSADLQCTLDKLNEWALKWQMEISYIKCSTITYGNRQHAAPPSYFLGTHQLSYASNVTDLGIQMDSCLKFSGHCTKICSKASLRANQVMRCFQSKDSRLLVRAFTTFVRPILEYCSPVWSPRLKADIVKVERVQRRFTKSIPGMCDRPYSDRLLDLGLDSLEVRRIKSDLVWCYKIVHGLVDLDCNSFFVIDSSCTTRGHDLRLRKTHCYVDARLFYFCNRRIDFWNHNLTYEQVHCSSVIAFKQSLKRMTFL